MADFQQAHREWISEALTRELPGRDDRWLEAIAVGSSAFVNKVGLKAMHHEVAF